VRKNIFWGVIAALAIVAITTFFLKTGNPLAQAEPVPQAPVPGMVTMVDLGAKECIPCKMMAPILEELEKEYQGRAAVIFIDVWKNPEAGPKFGIRTIPTQIFYDAQGKEITRHEGFLDKQSIMYIFSKLGVK
jgi:thioredoxin 1